MTGKINKLFVLFEWLYQIIIFNTLFLVTNSFFFQIFFFVDFQVIFFPLYFIVSIPLIPSIIALLRSTAEVKTGEKSKILRSYYHSLLFSLRNEYHIWGGLLIATFLTLTTLYTAPASTIPTFILYVLNFLILICEWLLLINLLLTSVRYTGVTLIKETFISFLPNLGKNVLLLIVIPFSLLIAFKISFSSIIIIFGLAFEILYRFFTHSRSE